MIKAEVLTVMEFRDEEDFKRYLTSDTEAEITGFANELRIAFEYGQPFTFKTPRPKYGAVVTSTITVNRV